jgi:hypothetical protein
MELTKFVALRKYLYHLTDENNLQSILSDYTLKSTSTLTELYNVTDRENFLRTRRVGHKKIVADNITISIRDQDPLFKNIVVKNLEDDWTFEDFVFLLNKKIFFWAKEADLRTHYTRYENQGEHPIILRLDTEQVLQLNGNIQEPKFCRLNSGAPRCSAYYEAGAPPRGMNTFLPASQYIGTPSSVREVTFEKYCLLPRKIFLSTHPNKSFKAI